MSEIIDIYVVAGYEYWSGLPRPIVKYAGTDLNEVKKEIRSILEDTAYYSGQLVVVPDGYEDKVTKETTIDEFVDILMYELLDEDKISIDTDFVDDYDEPFGYTVTHWEEKYVR